MNPNPPQVEAIKTFANALSGGLAGNSTVQVRAAMAAATVPNPVGSAPVVPKPYTVDDLVAALDATGAANLAALASQIDRFLLDVEAQDRTRIQRWARILKARGQLTQANIGAIASVVNATQPDPSWTATLPWDLANLGRPADDFDIEAARN